MKSYNFRSECGETNMFLVTTIIFAVLAVGLGIGFGWSYMQMVDYKDNSDKKVATAAEDARAEQKQIDKKQFDEEYKKPNNVFTGPANHGSVSFEYPKTWSIYVDQDGVNSSEYSAYFNPTSVPTIKNGTPYALRVRVIGNTIGNVLRMYEGKIRQGELSSSPVRLVDATDDPNTAYGKGTRIDGQFEQTINGSAVFFDIRGRTLQIFTDNAAFSGDFNDTILKTLKYRD